MRQLGAPVALSLQCAAWCVLPSAAHLLLPEDSDLGKSMQELVASNGYPIESHYVTTDDGYILNMFRIPHGIKQKPAPGSKSSAAAPWRQQPRRPAVLLQHALLDSSFAYISNSPRQSLGYILADAGYDVWFGNNRGNTYSTNHTHLAIDSKEYWDFTWDEMAKYDLPAEITYVLKSTGHSRLAYVGHSQGTIQAFACFSRNKDIAAKINVFAALAPITYNLNIGGLWGRFGSRLGVMRLMRWLGFRSLLTKDFLNWISPSIYRFLPLLTSSVINWVCGPSEHLNITRGPVIVSHTPAGTSAKNLEHWEQLAAGAPFRMFDHGSAEANIARYGSEVPPVYELADLSVPTALFTGSLDPLAHPDDIERLRSEVHPDVIVEVKTLPTYGHVDFTWAIDAHELLYPSVLSVISSYSQ